jgi:hypothetical protein
MSAFTPTIQTKERSKVHYSQYIRTENSPDEGETKPADTTNPEQPKAE